LVVWRNFIKAFIKALTPIVIIPACIISWIYYTFGLTPSSVLLTVTMVQVYFLWAQVEVAMRQARLNALSYEPVLTILVEKVEETEPTLLRGDEKVVLRRSFHIKVKNIGEYPAYNLFVRSDSAIQITPKSKLIGVLGRGQEETLWVLSEEAVSDLQEAHGGLRIDIDYTNILNEDGGITFLVHPQDPASPLAVPYRRRFPGLLLNSVEELVTLIKFLTFKRRMKKLAESRKSSTL
jgi:hypothetical protein